MSKENILKIAAQENNYSEFPAGSNKTKFGAWYGLNGQPWCAIFVSWVFYHAGHPLGKINTDKGFHYCPSGYNFWKAKNQLTQTPQPGDIVLYNIHAGQKTDHTGIFVRWLVKGLYFEAWEGNTSQHNMRDGGSVQLRRRWVGLVRAFVGVGVQVLDEG